MKIRTYLLLMALAILGPVVLFAAIALNLMLESGRSAALRGMRETARVTAMMVDRDLRAAEATLKALATSPYLAQGDMAGFDAQARAIMHGPETWIVLIDAEGRQLVNTVVPPGAPLGRASSMERHAAVLRNGRTDVTDVTRGPVTGKLVVALDVPVRTAQGRRYVLAVAFATPYFERLVANGQVPANWLVAIVDREGRFVARSRNGAAMVGKPARPELVHAMRASAEGQIRHHTWEGVEAYDVFTRSEVSGWNTAVAAPVDMIEADARRAIMVAALGLLAATICAVLAAAFFTRRLGLAFLGAAGAAASLGRGETPSAPVSDVSEVRELAAALQDAGQLLVNERASRLQAESERMRLLESEQAARKMAEAQNEAKDQFLAMLGHEIRNPLAAIAGASDIIAREGVGNERVMRAREVLERQSGNLAHIVDDLLDVTRVTNGKILLNAEHTDLGAAAVACLEGLRAGGRCGRREISITSSQAVVYADRTRLEQIINNLLVNAIKYTPDDGHIDVAVYTEGKQAVLTVRDSGVGMSPELLPKVFDLFVQGADTLARTQGGLGIGLTLVRQLVELHGGTIEASSPGTGKGSKFTMRLPLAVQAAPQAAAPRQAAADGPLRVLLIEDNPDARLMLAMGLGLHDHVVFEAGNGVDGIELAITRNPDVAVVDIGLPGMDGFEIASALRRDMRTRHIRLIALTGYGQETDRQRALDAGFDEHMVKPANMEQLLRMLRPAEGAPLRRD